MKRNKKKTLQHKVHAATPLSDVSKRFQNIFNYIKIYINKNEFSAKAPPAPTKPPASFATPPKFNEVTEADFMDIYTTQPDFDS